ncbi:MAG: 1-acyl-sn-glycerol-3-phosphate acyltransferase [Acidimicrobiales bacterium]|nr:1-acyl-sn-glycerol-3-phosphate acyltransferase [Acidimicrobiales bacterium]
MAREAGRLYHVARAVMTPVFKFNWRVYVNGLEHVPTTGPAIFCPNHTSVLDSFFLPLVLPRRITYVGKAEYMDDWKTKYVFPAIGMIPIDRSGGSASERALEAAARVLDAGEFFGIYPEGTRSRDGVLHKGHTGPARLAFRTGAPIIPVGLVGTREVQPPDARVPKPFLPVWVNIGAPIDPARYRDRDGERLALRQMIDEVMFEIRALSGQDYVDEYATKKDETMPVRTTGVITSQGLSTNGAANGDAPGAGAERRSSASVLNPG